MITRLIVVITSYINVESLSWSPDINSKRRQCMSEDMKAGYVRVSGAAMNQVR